MAFLVTDVVNEALDSIGSPYTLGDIQDGSDVAQIALRCYWQCLRRLLRTANWAFARKTAPLTLLADATGNTADVGTLVPIPWVYEYSYPIDCARVRFIPWNYANQAASIPSNNIAIPTTPLVTNLGQQYAGQRIIPARFVEATDPNYPVDSGSEYAEVQGVSPQGRTVLLTNVKDALCIYTAIMLYPSVWDPLFRSALVAYLASDMCLAVWAKKGDVKTGRLLRADQIAITKMKIQEARAADGNEATSSSDIRSDWMDARNTGGNGFGRGSYDCIGVGGYGGGWDAIALADGSVF